MGQNNSKTAKKRCGTRIARHRDNQNIRTERTETLHPNKTVYPYGYIERYNGGLRGHGV